MSECGVCIGGYDCEGAAEFFRSSWPKANKAHRCEDCEKTIAPGEVYQRCSGKFDGDFFDVITCAICVEIREAFTCAEYDQVGPPAGELWSDIAEMMFPNLTTACFQKLKTPQAKAELQRRFINWKGLAAKESPHA